MRISDVEWSSRSLSFIVIKVLGHHNLKSIGATWHRVLNSTGERNSFRQEKHCIVFGAGDEGPCLNLDRH